MRDSMRRVIHALYRALGHLLARLALTFCRLRDKVNAPKADTILFVAHPDDDTLFFHTCIKEKKPYVVLMTTAFSIVRMREFHRAMKRYGVRWRAYDLQSRDERLEKVKKNIRECMRLKEFSACATHNAEGEYGHTMHQRVHECVMDALQDYDVPVFTPARRQEIEKYPLPEEAIAEKQRIFQTIYKSQLFVLGKYAPWVRCEKLTEEKE